MRMGRDAVAYAVWLIDSFIHALTLPSNLGVRAGQGESGSGSSRAKGGRHGVPGIFPTWTYFTALEYLAVLCTTHTSIGFATGGISTSR